MASILNEYEFYCTVHGWVQVWSDTQPTKCPRNEADVINPDSFMIINSTALNIVKIAQESISTGGNYKCRGYSFTALANQTTTYSFSWPFRITISCAYIQTDTSQLGDVLEVIIAPKTIVGAVTAPVTSGTNSFTVSDTVLQHIMIGYELFIANEFLGEIVTIVGSVVTTVNNVAADYNPGSLVAFQIKLVDSYILGNPPGNILGSVEIAGKSIPPGIAAHVNYINNSSTVKTCSLHLQYLY